MPAMTADSATVSQVLFFLDQAFEGSRWHSLLGNIQSVTADDWLWVPSGGRRSIREIVGHVAGAKMMHDNHAFGDAKLRWDDVTVLADERAATIAEATEWLKEAQAHLRASIAGLDDAELLRLRPIHWGELKETRLLIAVMIEHDLYHAGEINHIRCLHQQNDE